MLPRREHHLRAVHPTGVPVADDSIGRYDQLETRAAKLDGVGHVRCDVHIPDRPTKKPVAHQPGQIVAIESRLLVCGSVGERAIERKRKAARQERLLEKMHKFHGSLLPGSRQAPHLGSSDLWIEA